MAGGGVISTQREFVDEIGVGGGGVTVFGRKQTISDGLACKLAEIMKIRYR